MVFFPCLAYFTFLDFWCLAVDFGDREKGFLAYDYIQYPFQDAEGAFDFTGPA